MQATSSVAHPTAEERMAMLRAMLADRFKLAAHFEDREQPVFELVGSRQDGRIGHGMTATTDIDCAAQLAVENAAAETARATGMPSARFPADRNAPAPRCHLRILQDKLEGEGSMATLVAMLTPLIRRPIVDKTNLAGFYQMTMVFDFMSARRSPESDAAPDAPPSIFTAMPEELGLKLVSSKAKLPTLIIDHIERPTPN